MKKNKILLIVIFCGIIVLTLYKYYVFLIKKDFIIVNKIGCSPQEESCFVNIECNEKNDSECTPYKYIYKKASNAPQCNLNMEDCEDLYCSDNESDCEILECNPNNVGFDEICL